MKQLLQNKTNFYILLLHLTIFCPSNIIHLQHSFSNEEVVEWSLVAVLNDSQLGASTFALFSD